MPTLLYSTTATGFPSGRPCPPRSAPKNPVPAADSDTRSSSCTICEQTEPSSCTAAKKFVQPKARNIEAHLVPFWSVSYICDHNLTTWVREAGQPAIEVKRRFCSEVGCAVVAVPFKHWCR